MLLELWALGTGREGEKGVTCGGWLDLQGREEASEREKNKARLLFRTTSTSFEVVSTGRLLSSSASPCGNLPTSSPRAGQEPAACRHQNRGPAPHRALVPLLARGCGRSTREQGSSGRTSTSPRSTSPLLFARPLLLARPLSLLRRRRHCCRCLLLLPASAALPRPEKSARRFWLASRGDASPCLFSSLPLSNTFFASPFKKKKKKKKRNRSPPSGPRSRPSSRTSSPRSSPPRARWSPTRGPSPARSAGSPRRSPSTAAKPCFSRRRSATRSGAPRPPC